MNSIDAARPAAVLNWSLWTGRLVRGLMALFLTLDAVTHLATIQPVVAAFSRLHLPIAYAIPLGVLELACLVLYLVPRTAALGAVLLTGYLGGAVAINLRAGSPFFEETLFPVYVGVLVWGGLLLRDPALRALLRTRRGYVTRVAAGGIP
jgi:hypothetical protein